MRKICIACSVLISLAVLTGCPKGQADKESKWRSEIVKTDLEFSNASSRQGMKKAFIEFMDNNGVLLRPGHLPIIGADAIEYLTETNDSSFMLTWQPSAAQVSAAGDLG